LLTAFYVLLGAGALTALAAFVPYGEFLCIAFTAAIAAMSVFEVVRLFARDNDTLAYRPLFGFVMYLVLVSPAVAAALSAVFGVLSGEQWWRLVYAATIVAAEGVMLALVIEGRSSLEAAGRFGQRFGVGFLILGVCLPALIVLSGLPSGLGLIWWVAGCCALNDAAAYFVGRACGRVKLAVGLSPNKSVEGSLAGLAIGAVAGWFLWAPLVGIEIGSVVLGFMSLAVIIAAQVGDLAKSYLKRLRGVKDLGAIFPGHGGVLDRFDALIAAAPVVLAVLVLFGAVK
jgi:phosphatidate cytidylyltransferase